MVTLTHIPFSFDKNQLFNMFKIKKESNRAGEFEALLDEAQKKQSLKHYIRFLLLMIKTLIPSPWMDLNSLVLL